MKKLILLIYFVIANFQCFGQSGALFQDWYLLSYEFNGEQYNISEISPNISPDLIINQDLSFSGIAACNDYTGNFSYDTINDLLYVEGFATTLDICNYQTHTDFELNYFSFFEINNSFSYDTLFDESFEYLDLILSEGFLLHYRNSPLVFSVESMDFFEVLIYPNPIENTLHIKNIHGVTLNTLQVYDVLGNLVLEQHDSLVQIDFTGIASGLYFVVIIRPEGNLVKKVVKE
jgi:hypothetical protein